MRLVSWWKMSAMLPSCRKPWPTLFLILSLLGRTGLWCFVNAMSTGYQWVGQMSFLGLPSFVKVIRSLGLAAAVYQVWLERNARILKNKARDPSTLFQELASDMRNRICSWNMVENSYENWTAYRGIFLWKFWSLELVELDQMFRDLCLLCSVVMKGYALLDFVLAFSLNKMILGKKKLSCNVWGPHSHQRYLHFTYYKAMKPLSANQSQQHTQWLLLPKMLHCKWLCSHPKPFEAFPFSSSQRMFCSVLEENPDEVVRKT